MMSKLIASDLDETLLGPGSRVVEENLRAIKKCQELGYQLDETMAIGDSFNDLAMIKAAGTGVGVANVSPEMRADCDKITEKTFDQGAVAEAIGRWVLPDYE